MRDNQYRELHLRWLRGRRNARRRWLRLDNRYVPLPSGSLLRKVLLFAQVTVERDDGTYAPAAAERAARQLIDAIVSEPAANIYAYATAIESGPKHAELLIAERVLAR